MFKLTLHYLSRHKKTFITMVTMLIVILTLLPVATRILFQGNEQVHADITDFARGKYDLLVRPEQTEIEEDLGLVEENYLGVGDGGITLDAWHEILSDSRVEVAAPVASLGFFTKISHTYQLPEPSGPVRYTVRYETTDGIHTYVISEQTAYRLFPFEDGLHDTFYPIELMNIFGMSDRANFYIPPSFHPVIAIDPKQEQALTGIDYSIIDFSIEELVNTSMLWPPEANFIPLIDVEDASTPIKTTITIEELDVTEEEIVSLKQKVGLAAHQSLVDLVYENEWYNRMKEEKNLVSDYLDKIETVREENQTIDFFEYLSPFEQDWYMLDQNFNVVMGFDYDIWEHGEVGKSSGYDQNKFFQASAPAYEMNDGKLSVRLLNMDGDVPIHRELKEIEYQKYDVEGDNSHLHYFVQVGSVSVGEAQEELAASPLGIYQFQYGNHKETGRELQPTHHAGSFLPLPAHGLISIDWAENYKGQAPIDAIRVKVAGISGYTEEAADKIREVAADIEAMGFHVDIIAGASHQNLEVDVEEIGTVIMPWTTLGAAESIIGSWNVFSTVIATAFGIIAFLTLLARFRALESENKKERTRLEMIGWGETTIRKFYHGQWLIQLAVSVIISASILLFVMGYEPKLLLGFGLSLLVIVLLKYFTNLIYNRTKKNALTFQPGRSFILTNIRFYKEHIQAASLQLLFGTAAIAFIITVSQVTTERIKTTNLGQYIHFQINQQQILLLAGMIALTIFTLSESFYRLWQARKVQVQFLTIVGWQNREIRRSFLKETLSWVGLVVFIGAAIGVLLVLGLLDFTFTILWLIFGLAITIFIMIAIVFEIIMMGALNKGMKGEKTWI